MDRTYLRVLVRQDFSRLIEKCVCDDKALKGICSPKKCYPDLYAILYPFGGFKTKSWVARVQAKNREIYPKRNKRRKGGKKGEKVSQVV